MIEAKLNLPELARFNEAKGIQPGRSLDLLLATTPRPICLFTTADNIQAASNYQAVIGKGQSDFEVLQVADPIREASTLRTPGVIALTIHSATDPVLFERMFADGPQFGQLLMGHLYSSTLDYQSPSVHVIGIANQGLELMSGSTAPSDELLQTMSQRRREILGQHRISNEEFRSILKSPSVRRVVAHVLGPMGTNIAQAMEQYISKVGVAEKTELVVHPAGIEPLAYAEMALSEVEEGIVPLHMECAVYYDMAKLFEQRKQEVVFADHQNMRLDSMQLASVKPIEELVAAGVMRIATHPSPKPLTTPWTTTKPPVAEWLKATSNAVAAEMVLKGEADACITTASSLRRMPKLVSYHVFGSPWMFFTIATPLNQEQLRKYR